jgi:cysteine desulfurase
MKAPIYLDYASTTPVDASVAAIMGDYLKKDGIFGNSSSQHCYGIQAQRAIDNARYQVASSLNCREKDLIFTSGATESNNIAIKSIANALKKQGRHIITTAIEHKSVLETCKALEYDGFIVTYLSPNSMGCINVEQLLATIVSETTLISIMHVNNVTGTVQEIAELGKVAKENNILFHVDAAQSFGKLAIDLSDLPVDLLSISAHKIYGPKGIGCLFIRDRTKMPLNPLFHGGGQEFGFRPGTCATHQIVGLGKAVEIAKLQRQTDFDNATQKRDEFLKAINKIDGVSINGDPNHALPNIINLSFKGLDSESLIIGLQNDIAISSGAACDSGAVGPSYVLRAMDLADDELYGALRISIGRYTTSEDIKIAANRICEEVSRLRRL